MIRQAHSYFAGAVSGATLIAAAVIVFVALLISTQAFRDWPIALSADNDVATQPARQPAPRVDATQTRPTTERGVVQSQSETTPPSEGVSRTINSPVEVAATGPSPTQGSSSSPSSQPAPNLASNPSRGSIPTVSGGSEGAPSIPSSPVNTVTDVVDDTVPGVKDTVDRTVGGAVDTVRGLLGGGQ